MKNFLNISFYVNLMSLIIWSLIWFSFTKVNNYFLLIGYFFTVIVIILHFVSIRKLLLDKKTSEDTKLDLLVDNISFFNKSITNIPPIIFAIANIYQFSEKRQLKVVDHYIMVILFGVILPYITESLIFDDIGKLGILLHENLIWTSISYSFGFLITGITHNFI